MYVEVCNSIFCLSCVGYKLLLFIFFKFLIFFLLFRATPEAYESSQARGIIAALQLLAYITARTMGKLSHVFHLHHSSPQRWILHPLSEARD